MWHETMLERRRRLREERWRRRTGWTEADDAVWEGRASPKPIAPEDPVTALQRKWIDGRLTDSEFERELDAVYAKGRGRGNA